MEIRLNKGSTRNTEAYIVNIGPHEFYFSYETCIAYRGPAGRFRDEDTYSRTTARHMKEMGVKEWQSYPTKEFEEKLSGLISW